MVIIQLPLMCVDTLLDLQDSLGGEKSLCHDFVSRYLQMWPGRFARIHAAVATGNNEAALDAALSLRSSSVMVGAARLGELTTDLILLLESHSHALAMTKLATLQSCGNQTAGQLADFCKQQH